MRFFFFTVELYNSQVVLKGVETDGHVIVSAAKAEIMSYEYQPVWQNQQVHSKTSWVSSIDCMQVCSIFIYQVMDVCAEWVLVIACLSLC